MYVPTAVSILNFFVILLKTVLSTVRHFGSLANNFLERKVPGIWYAELQASCMMLYAKPMQHVHVTTLKKKKRDCGNVSRDSLRSIFNELEKREIAV